ncbi:hypothetical protein ABIF70_001178 [Bradyrhizobium japonicum]
MISIIDRRVVSQVADAATGKKTAVQRRRASAIMAAGGVAMIAIAGIAWLGGLRLNLTPSEPLGLWRIVSFDRQIAVGDLVFVCPPAGSISAFGLERGYFRRGSCSGGAAPLIKTVVALARGCAHRHRRRGHDRRRAAAPIAPQPRRRSGTTASAWGGGCRSARQSLPSLAFRRFL